VGRITPVTRRFGASNIGFENKAEAERDAQTVRGEGDAKATEIYAAAYGKDPDFYAFYRSLDVYRNSFSNGDVIVLDPKSEFMRSFSESKEGKP